GIICILSFFLDFLFLLLPLQPTDKLWQINVSRSLVERGIVPILGLGAILTAYWFDRVDDSSRRSSARLKLPIFIFSSLLGLIFLLIFPLHLINVNEVKSQALTRINQDAQQLESQINNQVTQEQTEIKNQLAQIQNQFGNEQIKAAVEKQRPVLKQQLATQLNELIKDEKKYNEALNNKQLPDAQKNLLKQYKVNPQALDDFISQQTDPQQLAALATQRSNKISQEATQKIVQIRTQKAQQLQKTQEDAWKELRTAISSLLLSVGYIVIGWTGLKGMRDS
ncbi:HpsJ family protein, partial [Dolichospermum sp. ST_sed5]|nr:HpsJ family protein [Dolichospermum sp. ST_sed5]